MVGQPSTLHGIVERWGKNGPQLTTKNSRGVFMSSGTADEHDTIGFKFESALS